MKVLFLGSHCDDIELGCGGTINKNKDWDCICAIFSSGCKNTSYKALNELKVKTQTYYNYTINYFHEQRQEIWKTIKNLENTHQPDVVFTHEPDDHQDHVTLYSETIRNFKSSTILCYKPTIRNGLHHEWNWFEVLKQEDINAKLKVLDLYDEYQHKIYFKPINIEAQARVCALNLENAEFAEAFKLYKKVNK